MEETKTKAAETPIVETGIGGGEVIGVIKLDAVLVRYRDGRGQEKVRIALNVPGGELYFLNDNAIGKASTSWVKKGVEAKLGGL